MGIPFLKTSFNFLIVLNVILWVSYSYFMSDYFIRFPSYGKDVIFVLVIFIFFLKGVNCKIKKPTVMLIVHSIVLILYWFLGIAKNAPDKLAIRYYLFPLVTYYIITNLKIDYINKLIKFLYIYFISLLVVGYIQIFSRIEVFSEIFTEPLSVLLFDLKIHRLYLFFSYPNLAGLTIVILTLYFFLFKKNYLILILSIPIIIATFSRTAVMGFIFSMLLYIIIVCPKIVKIISVVIILGFGIWAYNFIANDEAFLMRLNLATKIWREITFWGHGIGYCTVSSLAIETKIFDNDYLRIIYEIGFIGLITFIAFGFHTFRNIKSPESLVFLIFILFTMFTCDLHSMYPVALLFYCMLGFTCKAHQKCNRDNPEVQMMFSNS